MKNTMYIFLAIFISVFTTGCDDNDDNLNDQTDFGYEQYGENFDNVPDPEDAVIYQVNLRAFSEEGTIDAVTQRLDYIKELGANVVYLMPIYPVGVENSAGGLGSPYAVRDYKAVSSEFGSLEDLQSLVEEAHNRDMAVVLDWVANHTAWDNVWVTEHPEYYERNEEGNFMPPTGTNWNDVIQLDFENPELQDAMIDAMAYWVYNANIDGFRMDAADYVPEGFWTDAVTEIRGIKDQEMLMLAEGGEQRHLRSGFDYIFGFNFFETLKEIQDGAPASEVQMAHAEEYQNVYNDNKRVVRYTTNHDVNLSDGTPLELFGGIDGSIANFVVAAYMKSVPMIYNGQEIGYDQRLEFFTQTPIDWSTGDQQVFDEYQEIIDFRKNSDALQEGEYNGHSSNDMVAFTMESEEETVLVLSNIRDNETGFLVPQNLQGEWQNVFEGSTQNLEGQISLPSNSYLVLKK